MLHSILLGWQQFDGARSKGIRIPEDNILYQKADSMTKAKLFKIVSKMVFLLNISNSGDSLGYARKSVGPVDRPY